MKDRLWKGEYILGYDKESVNRLVEEGRFRGKLQVLIGLILDNGLNDTEKR